MSYKQLYWTEFWIVCRCVSMFCHRSKMFFSAEFLPQLFCSLTRLTRGGRWAPQKADKPALRFIKQKGKWNPKVLACACMSAAETAVEGHRRSHWLSCCQANFNKTTTSALSQWGPTQKFPRPLPQHLLWGCAGDVTAAETWQNTYAKMKTMSHVLSTGDLLADFYTTGAIICWHTIRRPHI